MNVFSPPSNWLWTPEIFVWLYWKVAVESVPRWTAVCRYRAAMRRWRSGWTTTSTCWEPSPCACWSSRWVPHIGQLGLTSCLQRQVHLPPPLPVLPPQLLGMAFSMTLYQQIHRSGKKYEAWGRNRNAACYISLLFFKPTNSYHTLLLFLKCMCPLVKRRVLTIKPEKRLKAEEWRDSLGAFVTEVAFRVAVACLWKLRRARQDFKKKKTTVFVAFQEASRKQKSFRRHWGGKRGFLSSSELWKHSKHSCGLALITVPVSLRPLPPPHTLMPAICCRLLSPREFRKTQPRSKTTSRPRGLEPVDQK